MSAFSEECRRQAARYAERAAGYRLAGEREFAAKAHGVAIDLGNAAKALETLDLMEKAR